MAGRLTEATDDRYQIVSASAVRVGGTPDDDGLLDRVSPPAWAQVRPLATDQASLALSSTIAMPPNEVINNAGDYAFADGSSGAVFLRRAGGSTVRVLQMGDAVPGIPNARLEMAYSPRINQSGLLCLQFDYYAGVVTQNIILTYDGSTFHKIAAASDVAPNSGGAVFGRSLSVAGFNDAGDVAFIAPLIPLGSPAGTPTNPTLFIVPSGGSPVRVVGKGDTAPGTDGATFVSVGGSSLNSQGEVLISATLTKDGSSSFYGYFVGSVSGVRKVVVHGDPKPDGGTFNLPSAGTAAMNNLGHVACREVFGTTIYIHTATTGLTAAFSQTTPVPAPLDSRTLTGVGISAFNDSDDVLFLGSLSGTSANNSAMFRYTSGNPLEIVAYKGQAAPGTTGQTFYSFTSPQMNNEGDIGLSSTLSPSTPVSSGVFKKPAGGGLAAVALHGDASGLSGGGTLSAPSYYRLAGNGIVYYDTNIAGGSANYACYLVTPEGTQVLATSLDPLPAGSNVIFRTLFTSGAGNYTGFIARRTGGSDALVVHNAVTGVTSKVVGVGDAAPGGVITTISNSGFVYLNSSGTVVFGASVSGTSGYVFLWDATSGIRKLVAPGDVEPSSGLTITSATLSSGYLVSAISDAGRVAIRANFTSTTDSGIYLAQIGQALGKIVRVKSGSPYGDPAPGPTGAAFYSVSRWLVNKDGRVAFQGMIRVPNGTSAGLLYDGIFVGSTEAGSVQAVWLNEQVSGSQAAPNLAAFDDAGRAVFFATGTDGITGLYTGTGGSAPQLIAASGATAPAGGNYSFMTSAKDARVNVIGDIFFHAFLSGVPRTPATSCIVRAPTRSRPSRSRDRRRRGRRRRSDRLLPRSTRTRARPSRSVRRAKRCSGTR